MTLADTQTQVTWAGANTKSVAASSTDTSDAIAIDPTRSDASLALRADNNGTPASGDTVTFYALFSNGDVTGAGGADNFDTAEQGALLAVLDTNADDPAQTTVPLTTKAKSVKVYAVNDSSGRAITVSARLLEQRSS